MFAETIDIGGNVGVSCTLMTETLTTVQAAERLGVNVQKFHRLAAAANINPVIEAPGLRGAKFWCPRDVDKLARTLAA
jgi:hypothetical protein